MLGWNDKSLAIIQQLALANESEGGGVVVVLAENDKEALEELLATVGAILDAMTYFIYNRGNLVCMRTVFM
jgi:hypothetical protein